MFWILFFFSFFNPRIMNLDVCSSLWSHWIFVLNWSPCTANLSSTPLFPINTHTIVNTNHKCLPHLSFYIKLTGVILFGHVWHIQNTHHNVLFHTFGFSLFWPSRTGNYTWALGGSHWLPIQRALYKELSHTKKGPKKVSSQSWE